MTQVCFSHTSWEHLLARGGSVHLPRMVWWGQARAWVASEWLGMGAGSGAAGCLDAPRVALCSPPPQGLPTVMWRVVPGPFSCLLPTWEGWGDEGGQGVRTTACFQGLLFRWRFQ